MRRGKAFSAAQRHFRARRFRIFETIVRDLLERQPEVSILDAGGRSDFWARLSPELRPRIRITVLNFQSELNLYTGGDASLRIEERTGDACEMPEFADGSFDVVHSNSVIEHVGSYRNMARFAAEVRRVGRAYFVQTPNFWFPVEPHYGVPFVHWLPDSARVRLFTAMNVGYAARCDFGQALERIDHTRIISRSMMRGFFPDAEIRSERVLGLAKSTMAIRTAAGV